MCNKAAEKDPCVLRFVPFHFCTNGMTNKAIDGYIYPMIMYDYPNTQEGCERIVESDLYWLRVVPDHFKTQEMCEKAV